MKLAINALPAACFLLFGLAMIYGSITMEQSFSGTNEHRWVPLGMSVFVSVLAGWLLLSQTLRGSLDEGAEPLEWRSFAVKVVPCIALFAAYAQGQIWFGYGAATFAAGGLVFRLFQNSWISSLMQSAIATLVLYILFFKMLKLYNPPGRWLDLPLPF